MWEQDESDTQKRVRVQKALQKFPAFKSALGKN